MSVAVVMHLSEAPAYKLVHLFLQVNPYEPEANWFGDDKEIMPLSAAPLPKRRFIPSKWEEKK